MMEETNVICNLVRQGYNKGAYEVYLKSGFNQTACKATLKVKNNQYYRVISAMHFSRSEDYFSI